MSWLPSALQRVTDREARGTGRFRRPVLITSASLPVKIVLLAAILVGLAAILAPWLPLQDPLEQDLQSILTGPTSENLLGTDQLGRDLLSRTLWGARTTLLAAMVAAGVAGIIGRASALLLGRPKDYTAADVEKLHATVRSIVADEFARPDLPVVTNVDFGHTDPKMILPIGGRVRVDPVLKRITLLESPFTDR